MRVLVADDHSIVRSGLRYILAELDAGVAVVEATDYAQAQAAVDGGGPFDLVILDLRMPGFGGYDKLADLAERLAPVPMVVFSMFESPDEMRAVLARGVKAYIPKSTDDSLITSILRLVLAGGTYVPPVLGGVAGAEPTAASSLAPAAPPAMANLTRRQQQVLRLLAEGLSNQEIGDRMGLNLSTVKTHVTGVLKALGVDNRTQAVLAFKQAAADRFPGGEV